MPLQIRPKTSSGRRRCAPGPLGPAPSDHSQTPPHRHPACRLLASLPPHPLTSWPPCLLHRSSRFSLFSSSRIPAFQTLSLFSGLRLMYNSGLYNTHFDPTSTAQCTPARLRSFPEDDPSLPDLPPLLPPRPRPLPPRSSSVRRRPSPSPSLYRLNRTVYPSPHPNGRVHATPNTRQRTI